MDDRQPVTEKVCRENFSKAANFFFARLDFTEQEQPRRCHTSSAGTKGIPAGV
ncbi:hypothetical protein [Bowmanella dokdonensis]|uniref:Uncharacterized protein n=1 Tax=Bowmanella dokdonensis TaxID=751969 RepID=A0A939IRQ0_9ALTE|nr:hypothetical protein [Bowmanella dokdonensis]MBN7826319.1 hypothetical protein [Bowmanella dokdonensis]